MTDTLPDEDRYVVEVNAGNEKNPILKHRLKDAHTAPAPRDNLRQRVIDSIASVPANMEKFTAQFAQLKVPPLREDAEQLTYDEWVKVDALIAEYEPMAPTGEREGYKNLVASLAEAKYGDHRFTVEICNMLDAYNIDPRVPLLTTGRVSMGMDMAPELIAHFDMTKLESGFPQEEEKPDDTVAEVEASPDTMVIDDTAPAAPTPQEQPEPAQEPKVVPADATAPTDDEPSVPGTVPSHVANDYAEVIAHHMARMVVEMTEIVTIAIEAALTDNK